MDKKKITQIAIILLIGVWIATMGTIAVLTVSNNNRKNTTSAVTTTVTTTTSTTTPDKTEADVPSSTMPIGGNNVITTVTETKPQWKEQEEASISASIALSKQEASKQQNKVTTTKKSDIVPKTKSEAVEAYVKGISNLKKTRNFTLVKSYGLNLVLDDITGGSIVNDTVQGYIDANQIPQTEVYTFKSGVDSSGKKPNDVIPPESNTVSLKVSDVLSASAVQNPDGGYTITIKLRDETQTESSPASMHESVMPVIKIEDIMISGASIDSYEILYSEATLTATFDKNNRITYLEQFLTVPTGTGKGKFTLIPVSIAMHGDYTASYEIAY